MFLSTGSYVYFIFYKLIQILNENMACLPQEYQCELLCINRLFNCTYALAPTRNFSIPYDHDRITTCVS